MSLNKKLQELRRQPSIIFFNLLFLLSSVLFISITIFYRFEQKHGTLKNLSGDRDTEITEIANAIPLHSDSYIRASEKIPPALSKPLIQFEQPLATSLPNLAKDIKKDFDEISYNVKIKPPFWQDVTLKITIQEVLEVIHYKRLSKQNLSISLIDLNSKPCCAYAFHLDKKPRYPASITKLFWLVALYAQYEAGILPQSEITELELFKMIQYSDNEVASRVVDILTKTESGTELLPGELNKWIQNRMWVNRFFNHSSYQNINISQKNFPIPSLEMNEPKNRELQIRQTDFPEVRNSLTTYDVARLLYEIETNQAVSPGSSRKIKQYMWRDLRPEVWKKNQYNSIEGFLAESLPLQTKVISKVGWYSGSRQDAAIITDPSNKAHYILVIFGEDEGYANDWEIFPNISRIVYEQMLSRGD